MSAQSQLIRLKKKGRDGEALFWNASSSGCGASGAVVAIRLEPAS